MNRDAAEEEIDQNCRGETAEKEPHILRLQKRFPLSTAKEE
jgi:hypothetical protein